MKKKPLQKAQILIRYDRERGGWVIGDGVGKRQTLFATVMDAENYCRTKFRHCQIVLGQVTTKHQELPKSSVWTGAPWDHNFANVNK